MVLTGVWIAGSNVTEPHPFVSVCVCVCVCVRTLHPGCTARFHSIPAVSVGVLLFIVHTACCHTPRSLSCARSLGVWRERGLSTELPEKEINKGGSTFRQESTPLQPLWRLMTLVLVSVGVKKQVALGDSLHLGKIWRMEWHCSWLPDSSFVLVQPALSQMPAGEPVHVLYCKRKISREKDSGKMT